MSDWLPSLNALRAFDAVARRLSYSRAAEELSVTPAAVKQLVQKLEDSVGTKLVRRHGKGIALTAEGLESIADIQAGFRNLSAGVAKMRQSTQRQTLTITAEPSFASPRSVVVVTDDQSTTSFAIGLTVRTPTPPPRVPRGQYHVEVSVDDATELREHRLYAISDHHQVGFRNACCQVGRMHPPYPSRPDEAEV